MLLEKTKLSLSSSVARLLTVLSGFLLIGIPFLPTPFLKNFGDSKKTIFGPNYPMAISLVSLQLCASLSTAWLFYFATNNSNSILTRFLSAKIFIPFSRLSFALYLIHTVVIWYDAHQSRTPVNVVNYQQMVIFIFIFYLGL